MYIRPLGRCWAGGHVHIIDGWDREGRAWYDAVSIPRLLMDPAPVSLCVGPTRLHVLIGTSTIMTHITFNFPDTCFFLRRTESIHTLSLYVHPLGPPTRRTCTAHTGYPGTGPAHPLALPSALPRSFLRIPCVLTLTARSVRCSVDDPAQPRFHDKVRKRGTVRTRRGRALRTAHFPHTALARLHEPLTAFPPHDRQCREFFGSHCAPCAC
ncbi:hypothetical protein V8E53_002937 [Lactarius tabidus]